MSDEIQLLQSLLSVQRQHLRQYERHDAALELPVVAAAIRTWRREIARLEAYLNALQRGIPLQANDISSPAWFFVVGFHWRYNGGPLGGPYCPICYGEVEWGRVTLRHAMFSEWSEVQGVICCRTLSCRTCTPVPPGIMVNRALLNQTDLHLLTNDAVDVIIAAVRQEAAQEIRAILRQRQAAGEPWPP